MLLPNLNSPLEVLHKLERERYRTYHERNYVHKSDHFYNFCITALSLKDYVLQHLEKSKYKEKQPYYEMWARVDCLRAVSEIANLSKHCLLDKAPTTKAVEKSRSNAIMMIVSKNGAETFEQNVPDYKIVMPDGKALFLSSIMDDVVEYWKHCLASLGIAYSAQDPNLFFGRDYA